MYSKRFCRSQKTPFFFKERVERKLEKKKAVFTSLMTHRVSVVVVI
jgi:hypothetical protein